LLSPAKYLAALPDVALGWQRCRLAGCFMQDGGWLCEQGTQPASPGGQAKSAAAAI